jgi:hypothetical protein
MSLNEMAMQNVLQNHFLQRGGGLKLLSQVGHLTDESEEGSEVWVTNWSQFMWIR